MTSFQKNVVFVTGALIVVVCIAFGLYFAIQSYDAHIKEQANAVEEEKTTWREYNIRSLKALSAVGEFNTEEQKRLDGAGNDVEHMRQALIDIHQGRITTWQGQLEDAQTRMHKLESANVIPLPYYISQLRNAAEQIHKQESEAKEQLKSYAAALQRIEDWQPMSFDQYSLKKKSGNLSLGLDYFDEQHQIQEIWTAVYGRKEEVDVINHAPKGNKNVYRMVVALKEADIQFLNNDARSQGINASWFLCSGGSAICADVFGDSSSSYEQRVFSPGFEISGDPIATGLWRKGYWAIVVRTVLDGNIRWTAKSPSPTGWVSLKEGLAAGEKRMKEIMVNAATDPSDE